MSMSSSVSADLLESLVVIAGLEYVSRGTCLVFVFVLPHQVGIYLGYFFDARTFALVLEITCILY